MVNSYLLAKVIQYNGYSLKEIARILRLDVSDVKDRLRHGLWQSNELEILLHVLDFPVNPMEVFFSTYDIE